MISIISDANTRSTTLLRKQEDLWEYFIYWEDDKRKVNFWTSEDILKEESYLNKQWIKEFITKLKEAFRDKPKEPMEFSTSWVKNPANISFDIQYFEGSNKFFITIWADNKMRIHLNTWGSVAEMFEILWQKPRDWKKWKWFHIPYLNFQKYILDLENEIWEEVFVKWVNMDREKVEKEFSEWQKIRIEAKRKRDEEIRLWIRDRYGQLIKKDK